MPAIIFGGAPIAEMDLTYSWGLSPGTGRVKCPDDSGADAGDDVVLTIGSLNFYGVVTDNPVTVEEGKFTEYSVADNRLKLMWDMVFGTWNNAEVQEIDPTAYSGDARQKRYWHIYPEDWDSQTKTWTNDPHSAREILDMIFGADTVNYAWDPSYHDDQDSPVYDIDAIHGAKVGNLVQEILGHQGLMMRLQDEFTLVFGRKGDGDVPDFPSTNSTNRRKGESLNNNDPRVRLIGDRNRYQDMPVTLHADWMPAYEDFWFEPDWLDQVEEFFGPFGDDVSGRAALAAKARTVTVRQFADEAGEDYEDRGKWGEANRMDIPVWVYLQDIVFKAYRIASDYTVNGIELESIELVEGLLSAVTHDVNTGEFDFKDPREYYPDAKAFIIVQGAQIDTLIDPRTQNVLTDEQLTNARTLWQPSNKFDINTHNKVITFHHPVFKTGEGGSDIVVFPNRGKTGVDSTSPLYNIAVPNANVSVSAAEVRAVLVFEAERYSKWFGSGTRSGSKYLRSLNYHALMKDNSFVEEVLYEDGESVDDKATEFAATLTSVLATYISGGFRRLGSAGTVLTPALDRVQVRFGADGITEDITFTKETAPTEFAGDREMERRQKAHEIFPNQHKTRAEAENLRIISRLSKELKRADHQAPYANLHDVMCRPIGGVECSATTLDLDDSGSWSAGQIVMGGTDGKPSTENDAKNILGVIIAQHSAGKAVAAATQGVVPTKVRGPFKNGDIVGVDAGDKAAKIGGEIPVGMVQMEYTHDDEVVVPVNLNRNTLIDPFPFQLLDASTPDQSKVRVRFGSVDNGFGPVIPTGMSEGDTPEFKLDVDSGGGKKVQLGVDLDDSGGGCAGPGGNWQALSADLSIVDTIEDNTSDRVFFEIGSFTFDSNGRLKLVNAIKNSITFICVGQLDSSNVPVVIRTQIAA